MVGSSMTFVSRYESRELGLFLLFDTQRDLFSRAEVYNLRRTHEFSSYPVYWAGRASNEESLNYLKSLIDSPSPEINRLADRATFPIAFHDAARGESILTDIIRPPAPQPLPSPPLYSLGST